MLLSPGLFLWLCPTQLIGLLTWVPSLTCWLCSVCRLFPHVNIITEMNEASNMRFMHFQAHDTYTQEISRLEKVHLFLNEKCHSNLLAYFGWGSLYSGRYAGDCSIWSCFQLFFFFLQVCTRTSRYPLPVWLADAFKAAFDFSVFQHVCMYLVWKISVLLSQFYT